jgi:hypothetical protein
MSMGNVEAFRKAAATNPRMQAEIRSARSWDDIVTVARNFGFRTTVMAHLAVYRTRPGKLSAHEVELFRDGGFPWCTAD